MKNLKKTINTSLIISVILILMACPYSSTVPIDVPNKKISNDLIGKWVKAKDMGKKNPEYFQISDIGNNKCSIDKFEYKSSDSSYHETKNTAHLTVIEDYTFLNMQLNGEQDYYLYRIDIDNNKFTLFELTDNIDEKFNNSKELKAFIKKNMHLSFFYNKEEVVYIKE